MTVYGSKLWKGPFPRGKKVVLEGASGEAVVHSDGLLIPGSDGKGVSVKQLQFEDGKMISASNFGEAEADVQVEYTAEEEAIAQTIKVSGVESLYYPAM